MVLVHEGVERIVVRGVGGGPGGEASVLEHSGPPQWF